MSFKAWTDDFYLVIIIGIEDAAIEVHRKSYFICYSLYRLSGHHDSFQGHWTIELKCETIVFAGAGTCNLKNSGANISKQAKVPITPTQCGPSGPGTRALPRVAHCKNDMIRNNVHNWTANGPETGLLRLKKLLIVDHLCMINTN